MNRWRDRYFLPEEVTCHNTRDDCWITIYGVVKNVTGLIAEFSHAADLIDPILKQAGQDVSFWFDLDENDVPVVSTRTVSEKRTRLKLLKIRLFIRNKINVIPS